MRNAAEAFLIGIICCHLFAPGLFAEASDGKPGAPSASSLQNLYADLQKAIQSRDYRVLQQGAPGEQQLRWREGEVGTRDIVVSDMIGRLQAARPLAKPILQEKPVDRGGLVTIGTEGWAGDYPFRYFQFKVVGRTAPRWKWVGCYATERQDRGGEGITGAEEIRILPGLLSDLQKALAGNDFIILKRYLPDGPQYFHAPCGPGGREPREWDFDEMTGMLLHDSGQEEITFNPYPDLHEWGGDRTFVSIDTEGWASEYPFLTFTFSQKRGDPHWRWEGVCYDVLPPLREESIGDRNYFSRPLLPRPGPRRFNTDGTLRARIAEIAGFGEWDALKAYAVKGTLIFGECSPAMLDEDRPLGSAIPVDRIIDFLKKNSPGEQEITATKMSHATFYETGGWRGKYPFVLFWFSEEKDGWQLSGVTYCKQKQYDLPPDDAPWFKRALKSIFP